MSGVGKEVGRGSTYGHDEGVGQAGGGVGDLVAKLDVVVVNPSTTDGSVASGNTVEGGDTLLSEEGGQDLHAIVSNGKRIHLSKRN